MNEILALTLHSLHQDMAKVDRVAFNLANAQTTGYKREVLLDVPFARRVEAAAGQAAGAPATTVHVDQKPGTLKATGQSLDVALAGPGWFEVMTPEGVAYTRQGNFRLDAQGRLVTQQGHPVMGVGGEIQLPHGGPVIDAEGRVFEGALPGSVPARPHAEAVAQLKIVRFDAQAPVRRLGDGLVTVAGETSLVAAGEADVRQGFLENSNVSSMHEMVQLMQSMRHFETMQKVALGYDEMLGTAVRKLGETS